MKLTDYYQSLPKDKKQKLISGIAKALEKELVTARSYVYGTRSVRAADARKVEELTEGKVTAYDLCPEVFGEVA